MKTFVKICCMASREEAALAMSMGADALGLVSAMPSGPGPIADELIADIAAIVPPPVATFLLTCRQDADGIIVQHAVCRTSTLQLVDTVAPAELRKLLEALEAAGRGDFSTRLATNAAVQTSFNKMALALGDGMAIDVESIVGDSPFRSTWNPVVPPKSAAPEAAGERRPRTPFVDDPDEDAFFENPFGRR